MCGVMAVTEAPTVDTGHWIRLIQMAETPNGLEFAVRQAYRKEAITPEVLAAIEQRRAEIAEEEKRRVF